MILSIISGTWQRLEYLKDMVESARKSLPPNFEPMKDYEFVICDAGSTDGSLEWMREQPDIVIIEHGELRGAIKAFNDAGAKAQGEYLCVANDDVSFFGKSIAKGLAYMMDNPDVGAGCFSQNRGGKGFHVEKMPVYGPNGEQEAMPYLQVGLIPRWLWNKCEGWGNWGGRTYGGDNYLSMMVYQSGYKIVAVDGCSINDKTPFDELRTINNTNNDDGKKLWALFPNFVQIPAQPIWENPLPERKRVIYAPIIEKGHDVQKRLKRGLRDALGSLGEVWEVDYVYGSEDIAEAAEAWNPHYTITQFHTEGAIQIDDLKRIRAATKGAMINWCGDVWAQQQLTPGFMDMLRLFEYHTVVNASLFPYYDKVGIRCAYWQNSFEPQVTEDNEKTGNVDVVFLGNNYSTYREDLAVTVKAMPFTVAIYGRGYPEGIAEGESLYDYRKTGRIYRGAKILLADNQYAEAKGFASDRLFMALASGGGMLMHQRVDGMEELLGIKDGIHYVAWDTLADLQEKIRYYLANPGEREKIAKAGTAECLANHTFAKRVEQLTTMIEGLPTRKATISACLIVKDEVSRIEACLSQLDWADEIVVTDTGSIDDTIAKLEAMALTDSRIKIHHFAWCQDFSAARNFCKDKATSDWIFWLDADDVLTERFKEDIKKFHKWKFNRLGVTNPMAFRFVCEQVTESDVAQSVLQIRMFKNLKGIVWRGRVDETVDEAIAGLGVRPIAYKGMVIEHHAATDQEALDAKANRNLSILALEMDSPIKYWRMGSAYCQMKRWADAVIWFGKGRDSTNNEEFRSLSAFCIGYALFNMGLKDEAFQWCARSEFPDAKYLQAEIQRKQKIPVFRYDLYKGFIESDIPESLPTFAQAWKPLARQTLIEWHQSQLLDMVNK